MLVRDIALARADAKVTAIRALGSSGDPAALALLQALLDGEVQTVDDKEVLLVKGDTATDLLTGKAVSPVPADLDDVVINNRLRREIGSAMAATQADLAGSRGTACRGEGTAERRRRGSAAGDQHRGGQGNRSPRSRACCR